MGVQNQLSSDVQSICSAKGDWTGAAFAALKDDGSVVAWGSKSNGGDCSKVQQQVSSNVQSIYSTDTAFAALKKDGSVVTWGSKQNGGDHDSLRGWWGFGKDPLAGGVQTIYSAEKAFAALKID